MSPLPIGLAVALALTLSACGAAAPATGREPSQRPRATVDGAARRAGSDGARVDEGRSARTLGATASFAELVRSARTLEDRGEGNASAGCLLRGAGTEPWRLEADLAIAVRPLPAPWDDYDAHLRAHRGPARLLSRWGQTHAEPYALALATFTSTVPIDPALPAAVVVLTDEGAYVLGTVSGGTASAALPVARLGEALRALEPRGAPALVAVTAEAATPLASLRAALLAVGELGVPVTLAVPLAPEVRLPAEHAPAPDVAERGLCAGGLPEPAADAREGDLAPSALLGALAPLRDASARCLSVATGRAASGGLLELALRVDAHGDVSEACTLRDELLDPALRLCVLEAARALRFPAPSPPGHVDVSLPLRLAPDAALAQRPLCE